MSHIKAKIKYEEEIKRITYERYDPEIVYMSKTNVTEKLKEGDVHWMSTTVYRIVGVISNGEKIR